MSRAVSTVSTFSSPPISCLPFPLFGPRVVLTSSYSMRVAATTANRVVDSSRGLLNKLLPDVYIYTDHYAGAEAGL